MAGRTALISALAAVVVLSAVASARFIGTESELSRGLRQIEDCNKKKSDAIPCARPVIHGLLAVYSPGDVIDELSARLPAVQCHFLGHLVGQETYAKFQNVESALSACSKTCTSSCTHGVIGEAFARQLGYGSPGEAQDLDLEHLSTEDVRKIGKSLCSSNQPCHGVGHTLYLAYKAFRPALDLCREIQSANTGPCFTGVFMEYADTLAARNMRAQTGIPYPTRDAIGSFCTTGFSVQEVRACFRYFPRIVQVGLFLPEDEMERVVQSTCESLAGEERKACFAGIGGNNGHLADTDMKAASEFCDRFPGAADQAACVIGMVYIDTPARLPVVLPYCTSLGSEALKSACYQAVYANIDGGVDSAEQAAERYCGGDRLCIKMATDHERDFWSFSQS